MTLRCIDARVDAGGRCLLKNVTVTFEPGRFVVILGPNGAGKSTLLSLLSAQQAPTRGQVFLDEEPIGSLSAHELALRRAVMPQDSAVAFDFSVREVAALGRYPHRHRPDQDESIIVSRALEATDVGALAPRIFNTLSGGEKARVHMSRALAQIWHPRPEAAARWLLLDEPTAALDLAHQHHTLQLLQRKAREEGMGVVAVIHDLNLALCYADDALLLTTGEAACFGPVSEVLTPERMKQVWGVDCTPVRNADGVLQYLFGVAQR